MNYKIQLISFLFSFLFGVFFYLTSLINYKIIKKHSYLIKYLISFIYVLDMALVYILLLYKVNNGVIHVYFVLVLGIGFLVSCLYYKKIKKICEKVKNKCKYLKK